MIIILELLLGLHPWGLVNNGVSSFNGVLVGTVISILYPGRVSYNVLVAAPLQIAMIFQGDLRNGLGKGKMDSKFLQDENNV